ncbi:MAG: hypothetical protein Q7S74_01195 [Nanoarchaeota archaeon]|nr:hypothetical protein [Nanoarchaeota archaeon]
MEEEIREQIAELREKYAKLVAICGRQGISKETIFEYADQIRKLQTQLN